MKRYNQTTTRPVAEISAVLLLTIIAFGGCSGPGSPEESTAGSHEGHAHDDPGADFRFEGEAPIRAVCTTGQVADIVRVVGGDRVVVEAMMGPGVDPHLYRPTAADPDRILDADIAFFSGLHLEGRMVEILRNTAKQKRVFAVTDRLLKRDDPRLRKRPEFDGLHDPHVWHNAALWADCVRDVGDVLAEFDPDGADGYRDRAAAYAAEMDALYEECEKAVAEIPEERRMMVTAHDAFSYFGEAYGIEVFGLKGISSEDEKDLAWQEEVQQMLIERKIPAVFVESAIAPRAVESLVEPCREAGHDVKIPEEVLYADTLGPEDSSADSYPGMIRHNLRVIVEALK
ncbi:MAG: zinc ABC transporter substrate-binding protein [Planctomycetota bacterium]